MSLKEKITSGLTSAMKARDADRSSVLRMVKAEILNKEKEGGHEGDVSDDEVLQLLQSMVKKRRDSIEQFQAANRAELVAKEEGEILVLQEFLPAEASDDEIRDVVSQVIGEVGASSPKDLGKVMGKAMGALKQGGKMVDGTKVRTIATEVLSN